jgi:hypothetical protein
VGRSAVLPGGETREGWTVDTQRAEVAVVLKSDESGVLVKEIGSERTELLSGWVRPSQVRPLDLGILYWATGLQGGSSYTGWWFRRSCPVGDLLAAIPSADRLALLAQQSEVAALVELAATAMRQWRGISDELRRTRGTAPIGSGDDVEARVYREAAAALAQWRR